MIRSLRLRVVLGAILWTAGLLGISHVVSFTLAMRYPHLTLVAHSTLMTLTAALCLVAGFVQVRKGLSPFQELRSRLSSVRDGRTRKLTGTYPAEVQPLVDDLNQLLDHREQAIARAMAKAGDLAHGLKTPLAVLAQEADRVRAAGQEELAASLAQQVERMRRQIDYHLAHARAAASGVSAGQRVEVAGCVDGLVRTLRRLHADRGLSIDAHVAASHALAARREDVEEMLGNLLDNACRWARGRVRVTSDARDSVIRVVVEDDGPGLEPSMREAVLQRGMRADESASGSGFGLAIVRDLAALYGGSIALDRSDLGGLSAVLTLPAAGAG